MASARSMMKIDIVSARPDETVEAVARRMRDRRVGAVLVTEGNRLEGIFSERDLLTRVVAAGKRADATSVGDVATREVACVDASEPVKACAEMLRKKKCRHLPVVEEGRPIGIISARDFFEQVVDELERFIDDRRYRAQLEDGNDPYEGFGGGYRR